MSRVECWRSHEENQVESHLVLARIGVVTYEFAKPWHDAHKLEYLKPMVLAFQAAVRGRISQEENQKVQVQTRMLPQRIDALNVSIHKLQRLESHTSNSSCNKRWVGEAVQGRAYQLMQPHHR